MPADNMPKIEKAVNGIIRELALAMETRLDLARLGSYTDTYILTILITCVEEYVLRNHHAILMGAGLSSPEGGRLPRVDEIPEALPAVTSVTSALVGVLLNQFWGHTQYQNINKANFVHKMMREHRHIIEENGQAQFEQTREHQHSNNIMEKKRQSQYGRVYAKIWEIMRRLTITIGRADPAITNHLNPQPLWHFSNEEDAQYANGPVLQLIEQIEDYTAGTSHSLTQSAAASRNAAAQQLTDIAIAGMVLLKEINCELRAKHLVERVQEANRELWMQQTARETKKKAVNIICSAKYYENSDSGIIVREQKVIEKIESIEQQTARKTKKRRTKKKAANICSAEYYENSDSGIIVREQKVIEKMKKSWGASLAEGRTRIVRHTDIAEDARDASSTADIEGAAASETEAAAHSTRVTHSTVRRIPEAKDRLLHDMREAIIEGILEQAKQDMQSRHPCMNKRQIDYAVNLPLSLLPSDMTEDTSISSLIRNAVESEVDIGTINNLMDDITETVNSNIDTFLQGGSSNLVSVIDKIITRVLQALAVIINTITCTNSRWEPELQKREELVTKAEIALMEKTLQNVGKDEKARPSTSQHDDQASERKGEWTKHPLSSLSGEIKRASSEVVGKIENARRRPNG